MKNLLVAVDFSKTTEAVVGQAAALAKVLGAKLWVVHVTSDETQAMAFEATQFTGYAPEFVAMPGDVQLARDISAEEIKREHRELLGISSNLRNEGIEAQAILLKGDAARLIVEKQCPCGSRRQKINFWLAGAAVGRPVGCLVTKPPCLKMPPTGLMGGNPSSKRCVLKRFFTVQDKKRSYYSSIYPGRSYCHA
jgi:nucleotide-binding universal stress UspA family protein